MLTSFDLGHELLTRLHILACSRCLVESMRELTVEGCDELHNCQVG